MDLLKLVNDSLSDEVGAKDEYESMIKATESNEKLSEEEKSLITGIIFKIKTDEETHQVLLKIIKEVLESK